MSAGLLIVTHNHLGEELLRTARGIVGPCPLRCTTLAVSQDSDITDVVARGRTLVTQLDTGDGLLILTDAFGSTPGNVASRIGQGTRTAVVSGVNLPMLLRVMNYPDLDLADLQDKAVSGGRDGVRLVTRAATVDRGDDD